MVTIEKQLGAPPMRRISERAEREREQSEIGGVELSGECLMSINMETV